MNDDIYIMWLSRVAGLGNRKVKYIMDEFQNVKEIFNAPKKLLETMSFLTQSNVLSIISAQDEYLIEKYYKELEDKNIRFISIYNKEYPKLLNEIVDAPVGIYVLGDLPNESKFKISIIGSRRCSEYGLTTSYKLSKDLAKRDVVIVSGMAIGIDSMAHKGAVDAGGYTISVLGCGVDICYPSTNRALKEKILHKGCIISEQPPGTKPIPAFFPMRNRIISGLSSATIVVEAARKSGTLITVEQALEQGRDVLAVPGNITSKLSVGTNDLIKEGAALVSSYKDVLNILGVEEDSHNNLEDDKYSLLAPEEKLVYDCINFEAITVDALVNKLNCEFQMVSYVLTLLELKGLIKRMSGQRYIRSL